MAELDTRLLVATVFLDDADDMCHALVSARYPTHVTAAEHMPRDAALDRFLLTYLPHAMYAVPAILARHLGLSEAELRAALERLVASSCVITMTMSGQKGPCYVWRSE